LYKEFFKSKKSQGERRGREGEGEKGGGGYPILLHFYKCIPEIIRSILREITQQRAS